MLERVRRYLSPPVFPDDEDKTFTAGLLHVILWSVLLGMILYTLVAPIPPSRRLATWSYALVVVGLSLGLLYLMRQGRVLFSAVTINLGLFIILTVAAYFNGGVVAPAYGGYIIVIVCTSLLVSWQWGLIAAVAATLAGAVFLLAANTGQLPASTYSPGATWGTNVAYFFVVFLLLTLALRIIRRASQQTRQEMAERLKTEQALSHSEQRFRAIFDSVNDAIFVQDLSDGRILDVNKTMCEMYGYTVEEARRLSVGDLSSGEAPYTQQEALARMQRAAAGQSQIFEWQAKDRTGRLFWVEVNMRRAIIDGQDRLLVVVRDLSARKETEAISRREKQFAEDIINSLPGIFYMYNERGELVRWNKLSELVTGYSAAELMGKSILDFLAGEDQERVTTRFALAMEEGATDVEAELVTKDGQHLPYYLMNVRTELDDQVYLVGFGIDVSIRRRAEREAHQREAYLRSMLDNFPYLVWLKDAAGRFLAVNKVFAKACGQPNAEAVAGKTDLDVWPRELAEKYRADDQNVMEARVQKSVEEIVAAQGVERWFETYKSPIFDARGNVIGTAGFARDITDHKQAAEHERHISQGLRAVIEAAQELIDCADLDTLFRRAVELAREKLGLERCGLHLVDDQLRYLLGTFGTDERGQTVDERTARTLILDPDALWPDVRLWWVQDAAQTYYRGEAQQPVGHGWIATTPLRSRQRIIGMLYNDTAITHTPVDEAQQEVIAVYGSLLGNLIELKRTEAELAHERDLLQALMDNITDTIYFKDTASRFTRINRAQARLLGAATPEEALGKTDADFFSAELSRQFLEEEQRLMSTGEPVIDRVEYNPTPEGRPRWLSASKVPLRDATGQIIGLVGISRDMTDRVLAEEHSRTMSRGLRAVIEAADELIGCADLNMLYRRAVELAREKLNIERCGLSLLDEEGQLCTTYGTDMQRQTVDERGIRFTPANPEDLIIPPHQLWRILEGRQSYWKDGQMQVVGQGWRCSTFIRAHDRTMGVLFNDTAISHAPIDEAQQEVLAVYGSLLGSIIELKRAEEALRDSEALYRQAIEAAGAVPYYLDYLTESYRFVGVGIQQLTGLTPAEMQPASWDTLMQQAYPLGEAANLTWREAVRDTRAGHINVWRADYYVLTRDGRHCWVNDASVQVLDEQGRPRGAIGILQDITDRKQVELALRESEATMRALLDAIPDAIFRFDARGIFKDFIPAKNFAPLAPPSVFIGKPFAQVLPPEMAQQLADNFQLALEKGEPRLFEYTLSVDGQTNYYEARLVKMAQGDVLGIVRDVTDRKVAERALQQRESYLRAILDNFPYWFWLKDTAGHYLAANRTLAQAWGFSQVAELIGKTDWDVTPTMAAKSHADDQEVIDNRSQKFVEEIVIDQGVEKWFEIFKSPIFDAQGGVLGTAGFAHDVTARRQAEAAIRESEALFRYLADNAPALIAMIGETSRPTYLNRAWQEFRGDIPALPIDEWAERIHPDDRRRYLHEYYAALQAQRKFTTEYRLRRSDGQYRWLFDTVVPRYTAGERFAGFIGIAIDITDRKNAEEALRRSEGRLRLLTDNMVDSISQVDAQQRLVYASPSIERVFGHSLRDVLGRPLYEFVHAEDTSRLYHHILMATELHTPSLRLEYRYRHAAGHYLWVESEMRLLYDAHGEFAGAVFGSRDISARKQAEAEREQLITELEDKNAELERFSYTVSHDLKSPLITIRGFLGFLEKDAATGNLDRLRADVARIAEATTRMQQLLDDLLELSRIGRTMNPLEEVPFEMIVREAVELVRGRLMARGVQVEIADNLPAVYGDRARLVEVVQNLVDNAAKFMGDQPEPRLTIGTLGAERSGMPIFFVQDNGLGIEPQYHERIFGLFNKLDVKSEGTGVGLALVKRIVDLHGGHIWVESDGTGQGSTFFFTLPRP